MADVPNATNPAHDNPQSQLQTSQNVGPVPINVLTQYVKDLSFENPNVPGILTQLGGQQPNVAVSVNLSTGQLPAPADAPAGTNPAPYECTLTIKADAKLGEGENAQQAFIIECSYAGLFAFPEGLPEGLLRGLLMVEAPRLLFPFARSYISDAAQAGGFGPLLINPIDFGALYNQQLGYEAQAAQQQTGTDPGQRAEQPFIYAEFDQEHGAQRQRQAADPHQPA